MTGYSLLNTSNNDPFLKVKSRCKRAPQCSQQLTPTRSQICNLSFEHNLTRTDTSALTKLLKPQGALSSTEWLVLIIELETTNFHLMDAYEKLEANRQMQILQGNTLMKANEKLAVETRRMANKIKQLTTTVKYLQNQRQVAAKHEFDLSRQNETLQRDMAGQKLHNAAQDKAIRKLQEEDKASKDGYVFEREHFSNLCGDIINSTKVNYMQVKQLLHNLVSSTHEMRLPSSLLSSTASSLKDTLTKRQEQTAGPLPRRHAMKKRKLV
jgi:hypothetical protein